MTTQLLETTLQSQDRIQFSRVLTEINLFVFHAG